MAAIGDIGTSKTAQALDRVSAALGGRTNPLLTGAQVYYPACSVMLAIRFDEAFLDFAAPSPLAPDQIVKNLGGAATAVGNVLKQALSGAPVSLKPAALSGAADRISQVVGVIPKAATVELPGFRQAGKFSLTLDFRDLPIDPRAFRAIGVEVHTDCIDPGDFGTGVTTLPPAGQGRRSTLRPRPDTLRIAGFVDEVSVEYGSDKSEVTLEGRDYRGYLLDTPLYPGQLEGLKLDEGIDDVVRQILGLHPFYALCNVRVNPDDWPDGIPTCLGLDDVCRVGRGADGGDPSAPPSGESGKQKLWDVVTHFCYLVGAIPYYEGFTLNIRPVRSIYDVVKDAGIDPRIPTPFKNGLRRAVQLDSGTSPISFRAMIYGNNLKNFKMNRKLTGVTVPAIEAIGVDTSSPARGAKKIITARWPKADPTAGSAEDTASTTAVAPSGDSSAANVLRIPVPGVRNPATLLQIAQSVFEELGRIGDIQGTCETKNCASFGGDNSDPDLLRLKPGDPVTILVDTRHLSAKSPLVSELTDHARRAPEEEIKAIAAALGGDENLARVIVATARNGVPQNVQTFRVQTARFTWSAKTGMSIAFDYANYVEARYNPASMAQAIGPNTAVPVTKAVPHVGPANPPHQAPPPTAPPPAAPTGQPGLDLSKLGATPPTTFTIGGNPVFPGGGG